MENQKENSNSPKTSQENLTDENESNTEECSIIANYKLETQPNIEKGMESSVKNDIERHSSNSSQGLLNVREDNLACPNYDLGLGNQSDINAGNENLPSQTSSDHGHYIQIEAYGMDDSISIEMMVPKKEQVEEQPETSFAEESMIKHNPENNQITTTFPTIKNDDNPKVSATHNHVIDTNETLPLFNLQHLSSSNKQNILHLNKTSEIIDKSVSLIDPKLTVEIPLTIVGVRIGASCIEVNSQKTQSVPENVSVETGYELVAPNSLTNAPPTYSYVMQQFTTQQTRFRFLRTFVASPSYIVQTPPPTYAATFDIYLEPTVPQIPSSQPMIWSFRSMPVVCTDCGNLVMTVTRSETTTCTHICAAVFCCCCCLPYFINSCKNVYHYCPVCAIYLGRYSPTEARY